MANYQLLKADIDEKVYQNGHQEITGANLNSVLNAMVTTLGAEYQFAGVATKDTNPETTDAKVFYIANGKGTYTNFGGIEVTEDDVVVLYWDTEWHKVATGIASQAKLTELESKVVTFTSTRKSIPYTKSRSFIDLSGATIGNKYTFTDVNFLSFVYWVIPCEEGDIFTLTTTANTVGAKAYAILDENNIVLAIRQDAITNEVVNIPSGAKTILINSEKNTYSVISELGRIAKTSSISEISKEIGQTIHFSATRKAVPYTKNGSFLNLKDAVVGSAYTFVEVALSSFAYWVIPCEERDIFNITTTDNTPAAKSYVILGDNDIVISMENGPVLDKKIVIPPGGKNLIINSGNTDYSVINELGRIAKETDVTDLKYFVNNYNDEYQRTGNGLQNIAYVSNVLKTNTPFNDFPQSQTVKSGHWCNNFVTESASGIMILVARNTRIGVYIRNTNITPNTYTLIKEYNVNQGVNLIYFDKTIELADGEYIDIEATGNYSDLLYVSSGGVGVIGSPSWEVSYWVFSIKQNVQEKIIKIENRQELDKSPIEKIQDDCGLQSQSLSWLAIGDSFTEINDGSATGGRLKKGYMTRVCEQIPQLQFTNAGHSGMTFGDAYNFAELAAGYDIYTILFGTNDFGQNIPLGTQEGFTNRVAGTILGNFGRLYQKVYDLANGAPILVITSTMCGVSLNVYNGNPGHGDTQARADGLWKYQMQDAIIAACESENIPYVNAFKLSKISPKNTMKFARVSVNGVLTDLRYPDYLPYIDYSQRPETYYFPEEAIWTTYDGCHPSDLGMQILADLITPKMRELLFSRT